MTRADISAPLYIFGSSGHAQEVAAYARLLNPARAIWYVDLEPREAGCIDPGEYLRRMAGQQPGESVMGAGRCEVRRRLAEQMLPPYATLVHPSAVVFGTLSPGCVIAPGAVLGPNSRLGPHVMVNYNATVGHDTTVGAFSVIGPTAAIGGWCEIAEAVYVGAGALVRERSRVEADAVLGMGCVVTRDVPSGVVVTGVPGRWDRGRGRQGAWLGRRNG